MPTVTVYTDAGQAWVASQLVPGAPDPSYEVRWGDGTTAPAVTDTALESAHPEVGVGSASAEDDTLVVTATVTATLDRDATEAGLFVVGGPMLMRSTNDVETFEAGSEAVYTFRLRHRDTSEA